MASPAIQRTMRILDFLTAHPGQGFTASELARRLDISRSTAHTILNELRAGAFVLRHPSTHEYRLGPAMVPMGAVAERTFPVLAHARREAEQLAADYDADCLISMITGDELLIVARAGIGAQPSRSYFEGQRLPLAPPLGVLQLAFGDDGTDVDRWLDRYGPELSDEERVRYRASVAAARERGYVAWLRVPSLDAFSALALAADPHSPEDRRAVRDAQITLAHDQLQPDHEPDPDTTLDSVSAPVFGPDGAILVTVVLMPGPPHRAKDAPSVGRDVLRAAARVTAAVDGRAPSR